MGIEKSVAHYATLMISRRGRVVLIFILTTVLFMVVLHQFSGSQTLNAVYSDIEGSLGLFGKDAGKKADGNVDWSRFAYVQYVTDSEYVCNSVMMFERLHHLGSRADRVLMYPAKMLWDPAASDGGGSHDADLLIKARNEYNVKLVQIRVQQKDTDEETWAKSYTKFLAFNQTQYDRVLSLDSDMTILKHMDELFLLPSARVAMPRAYWLLADDPPKRLLSSQVMLVQPSTAELERIEKEVKSAGRNDYDMDILNKLYLGSAIVLPHRPYNMLSSEFRMKEHHNYLGNKDEKWNPVAAFDEAKCVHFSDFPVPKPWVKADDEGWQHKEKMQPECKMRGDKEDCTERKMWNNLYADFRERQGIICAKKPRPKLTDVEAIRPAKTDGHV
ncbi:Glucose N-acetyltransferase 1 [Cladobotryum mycophilum]|uniref:Glucose N-acetyltransferase 1 n=1 Tax=Cladobotryum mycophilum TaxID=491253 RepID=A0ABR0SHR5_9HYPO